MTKLAMPFREAFVVAHDVIERLDGTYEHIEEAGSLRRGASTVGDIELVAIPKLIPLEGLFGPSGVANLMHDRIQLGLGEGWLRPADKPALGDRYARFAHARSGMQVDCFMVAPPAQYGLILLIRTGPREWSEWLVTEAKRRGFHVARGALRRGPGHADPKLRDLCECEVVPTPDEHDVFAALGMPFEVPTRRGMAA